MLHCRGGSSYIDGSTAFFQTTAWFFDELSKSFRAVNYFIIVWAPTLLSRGPMLHHPPYTCFNEYPYCYTDGKGFHLVVLNDID